MLQQGERTRPKHQSHTLSTTSQINKEKKKNAFVLNPFFPFHKKSSPIMTNKNNKGNDLKKKACGLRVCLFDARNKKFYKEKEQPGTDNSGA
jgi:hypothetical protein